MTDRTGEGSGAYWFEVSIDPPAGHGTISVIGLVGYSCASAGLAKIAAAAIAMIKRLPCKIEFLFRMRSAVGRGAKCFLVCGFVRDAE